MNVPCSVLIALTFFSCHGWTAAAIRGSTSCQGITECVYLASCQSRHRDAGSDVLKNRLLYPCGDNDVGRCCPPVDAPYRNNHIKRKLLPENCGPAFGNKIANGIITGLGDFPWMALIGTKFKSHSATNYFCGGSVISNRYILTAAHCFDNIHPRSRLEVRLAEYDLRNATDVQQVGINEYKSSTTTDIAVSNVIKHPGYDSTSLRNDIALVQVASVIDFSTDFIKPICLPLMLNDTVKEGSNFTVAGWGVTMAGGTQKSDVLLQAFVQEDSGTECDALAPSYTRVAHVNDTLQICATSNEGGHTCKGDSGGPLKTIINDNYVVIGVVSLGFGSCDERSSATVFTRVHPYLNWIFDNIEK